jgi:hypothetical protein
LAGTILALVLAACGGSMSETEYVEGLNDLVAAATPRFEASGATYAAIEEPTAADLVARVEREITIMYDVRQLFDELDPPDSIEGVHGIMVGILTDLIATAEALVDRVDRAGSLQEAETTTEYAAYQAVNAESDSRCPEVQARFDELSNRAVIDDPWVKDLRLTVQAFLDC